MRRVSALNRIAASAALATGLIAGAAQAGDVSVNIAIGTPPPAPVVLEYNTYCVGYRANLYDADWRLRLAQQEQWRAQENLVAARRHEGEVALLVEDQETLVAKFGKQTADSDAAVAAARARSDAFQKRVASARSDRDAARTLNDAPGVADADARIASNSAAAARAADDLHAAEEDAARFRAVRAQLDVAQLDLPRRRLELAAAHDQVFAAQQNLDNSTMAVAVALHDRDEALWLLHRDEIMRGRCEFVACGFYVNSGYWGGRMPADPEVVHVYYVHPVGYWVERPLEVHTRVIEVERVTEVSRVREIQVKREPRAVEVVTFERSVPAERRRERAQELTVERERFTAERSERAAAAAEHRAPRITEAERNEARAVAIKARADAKSERIEDRADAKSEVIKARADAKSAEIEAKGEARSELTKARADAKSEETAARADARSEEIKARADARSEKTEARADAAAEKTAARADAKSEETKAGADAKAEKTEARADAKAEETKAGADAKAEKAEARADAKSEKTEAKTDPKADSKSALPSRSATGSSTRFPTDPRGGNNSRGPAATNSKDKGRDPKNKSKDNASAANDYSR